MITVVMQRRVIITDYYNDDIIVITMHCCTNGCCYDDGSSPKLRFLFILSTLSVAMAILFPTCSLRYFFALFSTHGLAYSSRSREGSRERPSPSIIIMATITEVYLGSIRTCKKAEMHAS